MAGVPFAPPRPPPLFLLFAEGIPFPLESVFPCRFPLPSFQWWEYSNPGSWSLGSFSGAGGWGQGVDVNNLPFLSLKELILRRRIKSVVKKLLYLLPKGLALFCVDLMYF